MDLFEKVHFTKDEQLTPINNYLKKYFSVYRQTLGPIDTTHILESVKKEIISLKLDRFSD